MFCKDGLWNTSLFLQTWPEFTDCFLSVVPTWVPCLYVWALLPYFIWTTRFAVQELNPHRTKEKEDTPSPDTGTNRQSLFIWWLRIVPLLLICLVSTIELIRVVCIDRDLTDAVSEFLQLLTLILLCLMAWYERRTKSKQSFIFFYFYFLTLVLNITRVYTGIFIWGIEDAVFPFTNLMLMFGLSLICLLLTCVPEKAFTPLKGYENLERPPCPEISSPYPSKLFFTWMRDLMVRGYKSDLSYNDVWSINPRDTCAALSPSFEMLWEKELDRVAKVNKKRQTTKESRDHENGGRFQITSSFKKSADHETTTLFTKETTKERKEKKEMKPNLFLVMTRLLWKKLLIAWIQKISGDSFMFVGPVLLGALINTLQYPDDDIAWKGYVFSFLLLATGLMKSLLFAQSMYKGSLIAVETKTVLTNAIYKKALTISASAKKKSTVGEIVNLMSVDCQRMQEIMAMFAFTWSTPFQTLLAVILLYQTLGVSIFAGVFLMALTIPVNYILANRQKTLQTEILDTKDSRIRLVNEILNGMKVLKLYAWELEFKKKVEAIRDIEITKLFEIARILAFSNTVSGLIPFMVGLVTFVTYIYIDENHVLDAGKAFVSLTLFNLLRLPMMFVTVAIIFTVQTNVSINRINDFLNSDDLDLSSLTHDPSSEFAVEIKTGTFSWDVRDPPVLKDIELRVAEGSLIAVIGSIGSGKSSLISAVLGEMHKRHGTVNTKGKIAYVSQQAWIQNKSVKDNILFGQEYDRQRYNHVINACQLAKDLELLDAGDETEIGEKGINISGGQKQRVNLARAAYSNSDIYLFDDPLSAVDSHVGKALFDELIGPGGLLANKTRILVTHGLQWLPMVDSILVMSDGRVIEQGDYSQLLQREGYFSLLIDQHSTQKDDQDDNFVEEFQPTVLQEKENEYTRTESSQPSKAYRDNRILSDPGVQSSLEASLVLNTASVHTEPGARLTQDEVLERGKISSKVYGTYVKAAGSFILPLSFVLFFLFNASMVGSNFWLSVWTEDDVLRNETKSSSSQASDLTNYYLGIYALFGAAQVFLNSGYNILFWYSMVRAGQRLHSLLLEKLFGAPMSFFDQTPVGRILNRFSRDVDIVDNNLPLVVKDFTFTSFMVLSTFVVVLIQVPLFGAVLVPLAILFYFAQAFYVRTSRQLKRMESIARSPVYTHFSETITGSAVIRAYQATESFIIQSEEKIDENQVYYFASQAAIRWLQLNLDVLSNLVVLFAALFQVVSGGEGSDAGLSVSYALQITGVTTFMVRQICEFETNIVCVERMKEYSQIEQEAALVVEQNRPSELWPEFGKISFSDYALRYRPGLQLVLKGVTCDIKKSEKVGIVGRTGAGKSSLTLGLFRIIEAAGGCIRIDGINIADIGLHDLRKRLTVLPQDPVIFSGSLRMNIDPFNEHSDSDLWTALQHAHLKDFVAHNPQGLSYECGEEGANLSVGQRQLVCLTRALLRKTKILILDEATAAVDLETDSFIQATIRDAFKDCTVLAIAHRLNTIMDYDKVLVMEAGLVKEFDAPQQLLEQRGIFYSMCVDAGIA